MSYITLINKQDRRYDSGFRTLKHLLDNSILGTLTEYESHYDMDSPEWVKGWTSPTYVPGTGMMMGLGTHSIDQALQLFGRPASVTAFLRSLRQGGEASEIEDSFTVVLQYEGDRKPLIATIKTTVVSCLVDQQSFFVRGTGGSFIKVRLICSPDGLHPISPFPKLVSMVGQLDQYPHTV